METGTKKAKNYITTYKLRFYTNNLDYLKNTQEIYNLINLSNQKCLRELEKLTIIGLDEKKPIEYFEQNSPTEFRRAAINQAIGLAKSYFELLKMSNEDSKMKPPSIATTFNCSVTF